jgi:hypothetical protein
MCASASDPISAGRLADELGASLPPLSSVPEESFALVDRVRELVAAVVMTDIGANERAAISAQLAEITSTLQARRRDQPLMIVRHDDGRVESLLNAGSGRLNPQAPPVEWIVRPTEPPPGTEPQPLEVHARCTFTEAHAGSPGRVYGGVLALTLDEVMGITARAAGATGMTVALSVSLKGGTPYGVPVDIFGRFTHREGRKAFASGTVMFDGAVTTEAEAIYVQERGSE